jgi:hypothetical protein
MRALARPVDYASCPETVALYVNPGQVRLTPGSEYVIHALAVFGGIAHVQVIDDLGYPGWRPAWLFSFADSTMPKDWICSVFPDGDPQVIVGPRFVAQDQDAYSRMVELQAEQVSRFWERLDRLRDEVG